MAHDRDRTSYGNATMPLTITEGWREITQWLEHCRRQSMTDQDFFRAVGMEDQAWYAVQRLLNKARQTPKHKELELRLRPDEAQRLGDQLRFWECCRDEMAEKYREHCPNWETFACVTEDVLSSIYEYDHPGEARQQATAAPAPQTAQGGVR